MTIEEPVERFATYVVMYVGGIVLAAGVVAVVVAAIRSARRSVNRARGAERPAWAPGIWHCASCLSTNDPVAERCGSCRRPREVLAHVQAEAVEDVVPSRIPVPHGSIVTLHHDPRAHRDTGHPHWRITVGATTVGSAARRDGVLALLRALEGVDVVRLDVRGDGAATFRLQDVVRRFEGPRFPLAVPCPDAAGWAAAR